MPPRLVRVRVRVRVRLRVRARARVRVRARARVRARVRVRVSRRTAGHLSLQLLARAHGRRECSGESTFG